MTESVELPRTVNDWLPWLLFAGLGAWGGIIQYLRRWRRQGLPFSGVELIGDVAMSGFTAVLVALGAQALGVTYIWSMILSGIAGHMGSRSLFLMERAALQKMGVQEKEIEQIIELPTGLPFQKSQGNPESKAGKA